MVLLLIEGLILMGLVSFNQAVDINCTAEHATIKLSPSDEDELGLLTANDEWYLGSPDTIPVSPDPSCKKAYNEDTITIPISTCGCKVEYVINDTNCVSISWHIRKNTTDVYHRNDACLLVRCLYRLDFTESLVINQTLNKYTSTATSDKVELDVCIETFGSDAERIAGTPIQAAFIVPARVYAKIRIKNADDKFSIHVDDCFITTAVGSSSPIYRIVTDGDADTGFDLSNNYTGGTADLEATFCFDSFAWVDPGDTTYVIQCSGVACAQIVSDDCGPNPFGRRRRRSTFDEMYFEAVSRPLWFINQ